MSNELDDMTEQAIEEFRQRSVFYDRCHCTKQNCRHFTARERSLAVLRVRIAERIIPEYESLSEALQRVPT